MQVVFFALMVAELQVTAASVNRRTNVRRAHVGVGVMLED
jgi:hypothetical protein